MYFYYINGNCSFIFWTKPIYISFYIQHVDILQFYDSKLWNHSGFNGIKLYLLDFILVNNKVSIPFIIIIIIIIIIVVVVVVGFLFFLHSSSRIFEQKKDCSQSQNKAELNI